MSESKNLSQIATPTTSYQNATGEITYGFTNDYVFRYILQKNQAVLKALICSLLHLHPDSVNSITITNPIELGKAIDNKEFILDIHVVLNNHTHINLEMQVVNELNWTDRSLSYLCRTFDQLYSGQSYLLALPVIHIGFLDFQLFSDYTEFYATYKLLNVKSHKVFSDKLCLRVVDLSHIDLATEEDKLFEIDRWARLFKATTWEETKMIAEGNETLMQATQALFECNTDELIRQQCYAREEYYKYQRTIDKALKDTAAERDQLAEEKAQLTEEKEQLTEEKEQLLTRNTLLTNKYRQLTTEKVKAMETIQKQQDSLKEKDDEIRRLKALLASK